MNFPTKPAAKAICAMLIIMVFSTRGTAQTKSVNYLDENGVIQTVNANVISSSTGSFINNGWYVASGNITRNSTITVAGTANLILENGCNLTVKGDGAGAGIEVSPGNSLSIYAQSADTSVMGKLNTKGASPTISVNLLGLGLDLLGGAGAGIGGGDGGASGTITINGGNITAMGGDNSLLNLGLLDGLPVLGDILNGLLGTGSKGNAAAGIGGASGGASGTITINGGFVNAAGGGSGLLDVASGSGAAGIGGGDGASSGTITINGGIVNAVGGSGGVINVLTATGAAGIGGGNQGDGIVVINGGNISAIGGGNADLLQLLSNGGVLSASSDGGLLSLLATTGAAGIGGGTNGDANITINGGKVETMGGNTAIGKGLNGTASVQIKGIYKYSYNTSASIDGASSGTGFFTYSDTYKYIKLEKTAIAGSGSVNIANWTYGSTPSNPVVMSSANGTNNVTYSYKVRDASDETYTSTIPTKAGLYTIRAAFAQTADYLEYFASSNFEIAKRPITISVVSATNRVYNGSVSVELSGGNIVGGIIGSDNVRVVLGNGIMTDKNAGNNKPVTTSISISGTEAGNYSLIQPAGITVNITPKTITITNVSARNRRYDGSVSVELSGGALADVIAGDNIGFVLGSGTIADNNAGNAKPVTTNILINGTDAGNYSLTQPSGITVNIRKMQIAKPSLSAAAFIYDAFSANIIHTVTIPENPLYNIDPNSIFSASDMGYYTVTVKLNDPNNYQWSDRTNTDLVLEWAIVDDEGCLEIANVKKALEDSDFITTQIEAPDVTQAKIIAALIIDEIIGEQELDPSFELTYEIIDNASIFTPATAGTPEDFDGTNGSYTFKVTLSNNAYDTPRTTDELTLIITATIYDPAQDNSDIDAAKAAIENNTYNAEQVNAANITQAKEIIQSMLAEMDLNGVNAEVIDGLFTPATAGTPEDIDGTNGSYTFMVTLNKGGGTTQQTIPLVLDISAKPYDSANDADDINSVKTAIENNTYITTQAKAPDITKAKAEVERILDETDLNGVTVKITDGVFNPATAGTAENPNGINGSYTFTAELSKGSTAAVTTAERILTITATPYHPEQDDIDIAAAEELINSIYYATTQAKAPDIEKAKAEAEKILAEVDLNGVTVKVTDGVFIPATAGTAENPNGTNGSYTFTVELSKGNGNTVTTEEKTMIITATPYDPEQDNTDIEEAKALIEEIVFTTTQEKAPDIKSAKAIAEEIIASIDLDDVITEVIDGEFISAAAGTMTDHNGTDGSYKFTVNLSKNHGTVKVTKELTLNISATPYSGVDVEITIPGIPGTSITIVGKTITVTEKLCDADFITVNIESDGEEIFNGNLYLDYGENSLNANGYIVKVTNNIPFEDIVVSRWNDNTMTIKSKYDGVAVKSFVWYFNGLPRNIDSRSWSAGQNGETHQNGEYFVFVELENGRNFNSCKYTISKTVSQSFDAMIVKKGNTFTAEIKNYIGAEISVYNTVGDKIATVRIEEKTTILNPAMVARGYLFVLTDKDGNRKIMKKVMVR